MAATLPRERLCAHGEPAARSRAGLARQLVECSAVLAAAGGAFAQGTGDLGPRITDALEPAVSAPMAAILQAVAACLLVVLHVFWVQPPRQRSRASA